MESSSSRPDSDLVRNCGSGFGSFPLVSLLLVWSLLCQLIAWTVTASPLLCLDHFSCEFGEEKRNVACSDPGIDSVPLCLNPRLISLSLHNTEIHILYVTSFRYYADLKYVNLSHNQINKIENKTFENQNKLEELHLADNNISHLDSDIFYGLKNLNVLSLKGNLLESVPDGVFQELPHLEHLDLSHNRITTIGNDMLRGLPRLTVLLLSQNRLKDIPGDALVQVPHLAEFSIGGNSFNTIHMSDLEALAALTLLDLSGTNFSNEIEGSAFSYVSGLRVLKLNDCGLKKVPSEALSHLSELEELELNRNLLTDIPEGAFSANRKLRHLTVNGNPNLERISPGSLKDNLNLERLDFSRNSHLTYLPPEDFRFLTRLTFLDLHGNHLQFIPHDVVSWSDVSTWFLYDNPITCNCSSAWLRKMLIDRNHTSPSIIRCAQPPALNGVPLATTDLSDLLCGLDATTQGAVIALSICGLFIIVACVVFFLLYRNRGSCVRQLLKGQKWSRSTRSASRSYDSEYPYIKPVPVTEL